MIVSIAWLTSTRVLSYPLLVSQRHLYNQIAYVEAESGLLYSQCIYVVDFSLLFQSFILIHTCSAAIPMVVVWFTNL